jgi:G3E family GTPase
VQYVVIESTGISEPIQVAETFTGEFSRMRLSNKVSTLDYRKTMLFCKRCTSFSPLLECPSKLETMSLRIGRVREGAELYVLDSADTGGLHQLARLDTTDSVIDTFNLFHNFGTSEFLSNRYGKDAIIPEDERTIADLMVDQLEFADIIIVNKIDCVDIETKQRVLALVKKLNPNAKVIEARCSAIDVKEIINTNMFNFEKAATGTGIRIISPLNASSSSSSSSCPLDLIHALSNTQIPVRHSTSMSEQH